MSLTPPPTNQPIAGGSRVDPYWERWLGALVRAVNSAGSSTPAPTPDPVSFVIDGAGSIAADGSVASGAFSVSLENDKDNPPLNSFYGADTTGAKGFVPVYDALEEGTGIALLDSGYVIVDTVGTPDDLPLTGNAGEAVRVTESEPGIYAWDGAAFTLDAAATGIVNVALAPLADAGTGTALKKIVRDAYGRVSATEDADAADVPYDNATSGLAATDVQAAIDQVATLITGAWTQVAAWDGATDAATSTVIANVGGYSEALVVCSGVAMSASGFRFVTVSVDGGSNYLSTNAYNGIDGNGVVTVENALLVHSTASASARSGHVHLFCLDKTMAAKPTSNPARTLPAGMIVGSASPVTHVRCNASTGNFNAGKIYIYAK